MIGRVVLASLALAAPAAAAPGELEGGVRLGLVAASYGGEAIDAAGLRTATRWAPSAALLLRWLRGRWSFEGELGVSDRGATVEMAGAELGVGRASLDLPILAVRTLPTRLGLRLIGGLAPSVQLGGARALPPGVVAPDRRFDLAVVLGVGAAWRAGGGTWLFDARFHGGVVDQSSLPGDDGRVRAAALWLTSAYSR